MRMQLTFHAEDLKNVAGPFQTCDPYAIVTLTEGPDAGTELGRTEAIRNTENPDWTQIIFVDSVPSVLTPFRVSIFDDNKSKDHELIGEANFTDLYSVFESMGDMEIPKHMQSSEVTTGGRIFAHLDTSIQGNDHGEFTLQLRGLDIKNVESGLLGLGRSDPFFEIAKKVADPDNGIVRWKPVYRSAVEHDHLNPLWVNQAVMSLEKLCNCNLEWPLKILVKDWEKSGKHHPIGQFETTIGELQSRIAQNGNGDRGSAFRLIKEGTTTTNGLMVVLKADLRLD